ncbi:retrovirus-related Pol polyprotein from type-2 retrotransposable element R2DM [Nephila pilipes]|uniref:Retrovirus-related Pol polyprotein from type-2 retrotransposable element R2DM n=1 Tax=Nephila pilipes TaxID=299642 RepID=A0A8X6TIQ4_NEPPI|nr:retrovirus-related Pol polyprotein from type-2 retrotransposable element R2DM [Nephila pilipes]
MNNPSQVGSTSKPHQSDSTKTSSSKESSILPQSCQPSSASFVNLQDDLAVSSDSSIKQDSPNILDMILSPQSNNLDPLNAMSFNKIRSLPLKFLKEKFPELLIFQNSSSSPEITELSQQLKSPVTGPPTFTSFTKPKYSTVAKRNLFKCNYCSKQFYSEIGLSSHLIKHHNVKEKRQTNNRISSSTNLPNTINTSSCFSSLQIKPPSPEAFTEKIIKKGVLRCKYCEKPYKIKRGLTLHLQHVHEEPPRKIPFKLFPKISRPICRTCFQEIEEGLSLSDHCKLLHNLEITSDIKEVFSEISTVPPTLPSHPSSSPRKVSCHDDSKEENFIIKVKRNNSQEPPPNSLEDFAIKKDIVTKNSSPPLPKPSSKQCPHCPFTAIKKAVFSSIFITTMERVVNYSTAGPSVSFTSSSQDNTQCPLCDMKMKTAKGLRDNAPLNSSSNLHPPVSPTRIPTTSSLPDEQQSTKAIVPNARDIDFLGSSASLVGSTLKYTFPLEETLKCPVSKCLHSFHTRKWFTTNTSLKKHLTIYHKLQISSVEHWCSLCKTRLKTRPALHPCLKGSLTVPAMNSTSPTWVLLETFRLPPPLPPFQDILEPATSSYNPNEAVPFDKIEAEEPQLLATFDEPLDALLEDGVDNKMALLEILLQDITKVIQDKFHLKTSAQFSNRNASKPFVSGSARILKASLANDAQAVQKAYAWKRRKCIRDLVNPNSLKCNLSPNDIHSYFSKIWDDCQEHSIPNFGSPPDLPPNIENFITDMVKESLHSAENTAPGPDGISYKHWREVDPSGVILCKIFNLCLPLRQIPDTWKTSLTILIHKKGPTEDLANWRPISLSNTICKLFTKCLTRKLSDWCSSNNCLSPNQKGFLPFDGVLEHNFIIAQHLESATGRKKDSLACWLDISNAFGSIHHDVLLAALSAIGADSDFVALVKNMYSDSSSSIICNESNTEPIPCRRGVKQGCPLSGLLFNIAIDNLLRNVQGDYDNKKILAFADDLVVLAESPEELQDLLGMTMRLLESLHLQPNPGKCAFLHLSGITPVVLARQDSLSMECQ